MSRESPVLLWFRRDLRLADNPALEAAVRSGRPIIPVYVLEPAPGGRSLGSALKWWLDKSLRALSADLKRRQGRLILRRGDAADILVLLAEETGAAEVVWNRLPELGSEASLRSRLESRNIAASTFNAAFMVEPGTLLNGSGEAYKVFTPFWRAARARLGHPEVPPAPETLRAPQRWPASDDLDDWALHPRDPDWSQGFSGWRPGEAGAQALLERFIEEALGAYAVDRDRPGIAGSSRLSPHLRWGEIGPRQVWRAVEHALPRHHGAEAQAEKFFAELGWREFNSQTLLARPDLARVDFKPGFENLPWRNDPKSLAAWRRGLTGYPVVDAGMRELWTTGWMHNRVRLITASFLVKHLLINWREGETWFWDTLVDADPANNPANWQWIAGSGADASPFFRIFNPVAQGQKFDPDGAYVRRWVPELAGLSDDLIHAPWLAPSDVLAGAGIRLGRDYPRPIVDHAAARVRALDALKSARTGADSG